MRVSHAKLQVAYAGEAVDSGSMEVKELAPALLALGALIEEANNELYGKSACVSVRIRSDFRKGSFELYLEIAQTLAEQIGMLLAGSEQPTTEELLQMIGFWGVAGPVGLFQLLKWLKGRQPTRKTVLENGNVRLEVDGEMQAIEVRNGVLKLYNSGSVRSRAREVLNPLEEPGIDEFQVKLRDKPVLAIGKEELGYYDLPEVRETELLNTTQPAWLQCISVVFEKDRKWQFSMGDGNRFHASIEDEEFLTNLEKGAVAFSKGDRLLVDLHMRQWEDTKGIHTEYKVLKVHKHRHGSPDQLRLFPEN